MRRVAVVVAACVALAGCGSSGGNNDQGIVFRALGVFQESVEQFAPAADTLPSIDEAFGDTGRTIVLANTFSVPNDQNGDGDLDGGFIGVENQLAFQDVNVQGIQVEIWIPGALFNPVATDYVPMAISLTPPSLVDGEVAGNISYAQTLFVSPDLIAFLNQNPGLLPPTPYDMNVVMRVEAISDSGEFYESNQITYRVGVL